MRIQLAVAVAVGTLAGAQLGWILVSLFVRREWTLDLLGPVLVTITGLALGLRLLQGGDVGSAAEGINLVLMMLFAAGVLLDVYYRRAQRTPLRGGRPG